MRKALLFVLLPLLVVAIGMVAALEYTMSGEKNALTFFSKVKMPDPRLSETACDLPWGGRIAEGDSVDAFENELVSHGRPCVSEVRLCTRGHLEGNFMHRSCSVEAPPLPTCRVDVSPASLDSAGPVTLAWSSIDAETFFIRNIGYVSAFGSTTVIAMRSTEYAGEARNKTGLSACGGNDRLHIQRTCVFNGEEVPHGASVEAYAAPIAPFGGACASEKRICADGTLSGSYAHAQCTVAAPSDCVLGDTTVVHGERAVFYSSASAPSGQTCAAVSQTRTCTNGTLSGDASYHLAACFCSAGYTCSGQQVIYTNGLCGTSVVRTCAAPLTCTPGVPTCSVESE